MFFYQIKIQIKPYKTEEFISSLHTILPSVRKDKSCLDVRVYQDSEKENTYILVGEWQTRQSMEKHFKTSEFGVFIGAAKVLCDSFSMNITKALKTDGFELARELIAS